MAEAQKGINAEVVHVGSSERPWKSGKGQEYVSYRVKLRIGEEEIENVEINRKPETEPVKPGETIFGDFDPRPDSDYGPRFFKKTPGGGGGGRGGGGKSPIEQARIQRQHSQEMAVRVGAAAGWFEGASPNDTVVFELLAKKDGPLKRLIDLFDQDIDRGAENALERRQNSGSQ